MNTILHCDYAMGNKREKRLLKQQQKIDEQQQKNVRILNSLTIEKTPIVEKNVEENRTPNLAPHLLRQLEEEKKKIPSTTLNLSRFSQKVTWCKTNADTKGSWSWGETREWDDNEWKVDIEPKLTDFSQLTWKEIDSHSSESGHKMHHGHELGDLHDEAQERWLLELELDEFSDEIFRFRLGATQRAWGYIVQAHFFLIWFERKHIIYKVEKK